MNVFRLSFILPKNILSKFPTSTPFFKLMIKQVENTYIIYFVEKKNAYHGLFENSIDILEICY